MCNAHPGSTRSHHGHLLRLSMEGTWIGEPKHRSENMWGKAKAPKESAVTKWPRILEKTSPFPLLPATGKAQLEASVCAFVAFRPSVRAHEEPGVQRCGPKQNVPSCNVAPSSVQNVWRHTFLYGAGKRTGRLFRSREKPIFDTSGCQGGL